MLLISKGKENKMKEISNWGGNWEVLQREREEKEITLRLFFFFKDLKKQ